MKTIKEYLGNLDGTQQAMKSIADILVHLNVKRIRETMETLDWTWTRKTKDGKFETYSPDEDEIRNNAMENIYLILKHATDENVGDAEYNRHYFIQTGGWDIELEVFTDEMRKRGFGDDAPDDFEHSVGITIKFVVEETESESWLYLR